MSSAAASASTVYPATTSEWLRPEERPQVILELIDGVDRYNPANLPILEDYLYDQVRRGTYDALANLATLKLYQFNPSLLNTDVLINLLLKALVATPGPDFNLAMALVSDRAHSIPLPDEDDELETSLPLLLPFLSQLHTLLRTCRFSAFWALLNSDDEAAVFLRQNTLMEHPLFAPLIRTHVVARAIASTHQRVSLVLLGKWTDLAADSAELKTLVTDSLGWKIEEGDIVRIPANADNDVKGKTVREVVELPQLVKIIAAGN